MADRTFLRNRRGGATDDRDQCRRRRARVLQGPGLGWLDDVEVQVFEGPNEYLYGQETAMLEATDGRPPFPRIAPPYRRGVHEIIDPTFATDSSNGSAVHVQLAGPSADSFGSPTLVNNVETLACKEDGLALASLFGRVRSLHATTDDLAAITARLETVVEGARCTMASQYQLVLQSILDNFSDELDAHLDHKVGAAQPEHIASIVKIEGPVAYLDERHRAKQPDWTFERRWSGKSPADRLSTVGGPQPDLD